MWQTREVFAEVFGRSWEALQMNLIYDVAHNIAKIERASGRGVSRKALRASQRSRRGRFRQAIPKCR